MMFIVARAMRVRGRTHREESLLAPAARRRETSSSPAEVRVEADLANNRRLDSKDAKELVRYASGASWTTKGAATVARATARVGASIRSPFESMFNEKARSLAPTSAAPGTSSLR